MIWIKRLFIALTFIVLIALGLGVYLGYKYQDKAVPVIVEQLNQYLLTPVDVAEISLSFIERFPQASLKLSNVSALGSNSSINNDTLFHLGEVYLTFNLIDLYKGNYILNNVEAHNGYLHLNRQKNGDINYRFIDTSLTTQSSGSFKLDLNRILLDQVQVEYVDETNNEHILIDAHRFSAKGSFTKNNQSVALYGSSTVRQFKIGELSYLTDELVFIDAGLEFNPELEFYQISRGILKLQDTYELNLSGKIKGREIDLVASADHLTIEALPTLLPQTIAKPINDLHGKGVVAVYTHIKREASEEFPSIQSSLVIQQASIRIKAFKEALKIDYAKANFSNGNKRTLATSTLLIDSAQIKLGRSTLNGKARIKNFNSLIFRLEADVQLDGESIKEATELKELETLQGIAKGNLKLSGKIPTDSLSAQHLISWKKEAEFDLKNVVVETDSIKLSIHTGMLSINQGSMVLENTNALWNNNEFNISGWSRNGFHALLAGSVPTHFRGEISATKYTSTSADTSNSFTIPKDYDVEVQLQIAELNYNKLKAKDVQTKLTLNKALSLSNLSANMLDGTLQGDISLTPIGKNIRTKLSLSGRHLNIKELFKTFNNFEQTAINHKHLIGFADIDAQFKFQQDQNRNTIKPSILGNARVRITNGELVEYPPLYELVEDFRKNKILSLFVKLDDFEQKLHHVKFDTLENTLSVANNMVTIPEMNIRSSALDLTLNGKQSFDQDLDYHMSFNLKQVLLANRDKPTPTEYGYIEDDGTGNKMIYLHITGNANNPTVTFDKLASKKRRKEVVQKELKTTKAILKEEFGLFQGDSLAPLPKVKNTPKNELDLDEFDKKLEEQPQDSTPATTNADTSKRTSKWKKLLKKVSGEESNSKFENWEFEENDDW